MARKGCRIDVSQCTPIPSGIYFNEIRAPKPEFRDHAEEGIQALAHPCACRFIQRRNAAGCDRAASLLSDLRALAVEEGSQADFRRRLASIRALYDKKGKFIERLTKLGCNSDDGGA